MKKLVFVLTCIACLVPGFAFAQEDPCLRGNPRQRASCYTQAAMGQLSGSPREASRLFLLAFNSSPSCALLFNGALALERVPDATAALAVYRRIQIASCADHDTVLRQALPAIVRLEAALHHGVTPVPVPVPVPLPIPVPVPPVVQMFHVSVEEFRLLEGHPLHAQIRARSTTTIGSQEVLMEEVFRDSVRLALAEVRHRQALLVRPRVRDTRPIPVLSWTLWSVGAASLGFGVYSLWARGDALDRSSQDSGRAERAANAAGISAGVSLGVGAVAIGVGTVLFFTRPTRRVAIVPTLGGLSLVGRF